MFSSVIALGMFCAGIWLPVGRHAGCSYVAVLSAPFRRFPLRRRHEDRLKLLNVKRRCFLTARTNYAVDYLQVCSKVPTVAAGKPLSSCLLRVAFG